MSAIIDPTAGELYATARAAAVRLIKERNEMADKYKAWMKVASSRHSQIKAQFVRIVELERERDQWELAAMAIEQKLVVRKTEIAQLKQQLLDPDRCRIPGCTNISMRSNGDVLYVCEEHYDAEFECAPSFETK